MADISGFSQMILSGPIIKHSKGLNSRVDIVWVVHHVVPLTTEIFPVLKELEGSGFSSTIACWHDPDRSIRRTCNDLGISFTLVCGDERDSRVQHQLVRRVVSQLLRPWRFWKRLRAKKEFLFHSEAKLIVVLDDRSVDGAVWCKAAELQQIPSVLLQWAVFVSAENMKCLKVRVNFRRNVIASLLYRIGGLFGVFEWIEGKPTAFYSFADSICLKIFNCFPRNEWIYGGGRSSYKLYFGKYWADLAVSGGVSARQVIVSGSAAQDRWTKLVADRGRIRKEVRDSLRIEGDLPLVIVISPALSFREKGASRSSEVDFASLKQELIQVVDLISQHTAAEVLLKCHPRDDGKEYFSFRDFKCPQKVSIIQNCDTERVILASDLTLCHWSSTLLPAVAMEIPVAVLDFRGSPSSSVWRTIPGLRVFKDLEELRLSLAKQSPGDIFASALRMNSLERKKFLSRYLVLDGNCTNRIRSALLDIMRVN